MSSEKRLRIRDCYVLGFWAQWPNFVECSTGHSPNSSEVSDVVDDSSGLHTGPGRGLSRCFSDRTIGIAAVLHRSPVTA